MLDLAFSILYDLVTSKKNNVVYLASLDPLAGGALLFLISKVLVFVWSLSSTPRITVADTYWWTHVINFLFLVLMLP